VSTPAAAPSTVPPVIPAGRSRREARERAQRRRSGLIAAVSTVVVFGVVATVVGTSEGWPDVRRSFFDGAEFADAFPDIVSAFWLNVRIFVIAQACILVFAMVIALARSSRSPYLFPVRIAATVYVDLFRGVPVLLVLFLLGFGIPALRLSGVPNDPIFWGTVTLVLTYSAYVSEVYRAGIDGVHESQRAAARSLGLTSSQTLRHVVLPQAVRKVIPPLLNDFISLQKDTALVGVIGPIEAARQAQIHASRTFNFTSYVAAAVIFLVITVPATRLTDWLIARQQRRRTIGPVR
jgi:polar amino acid transport system permease protein